MEPAPVYPETRIIFVERREEPGGAYTYVFMPEEAVSFHAGQYVHMRLSDMPEGEKAVREFSFASAPSDPALQFGIDARSGSPYQKRLAALQPGDTVRLFKIKGHMTWPPPSVSAVVMIAGGVGVTPFRSMLRDRAFRVTPLSATLLHVGRTPTLLYEKEISGLADTYERLSRGSLPDALARAAREKPDAHYYLAGSPGFVASVKDMLAALGITRVELDEFKGLLDETP